MTTFTFEDDYSAKRLNGGRPILSQKSFTDLDPAFAKQGANINGPSVIRIPDWIAAGDRADPSAVYYCYFGNHTGKYIRMAWAADVEGPWTLYGMHLLSSGISRGVLDLGRDGRIRLQPTENDTIEIFGHISSPDVHVDDENERIVLYFHGPAKHNDRGGRGLDQKTFVAFSDDGLDFNGSISPVYLGLAYLRVFTFDGKTYGIASRGNLYTAPENPHAPVDPNSFDFSSDLWALEGSSYTDTPFQQDINADSSPDAPDRARHFAVRVNGDTLEVFHSRVGDAPERILFTTIDLTAGPTSAWDPVYPPSEVIWPEKDWEGADRPLSSSSGGASVNVRELRDPYVFEDRDGALYLFYTGAGEEAIGVAQLSASSSEPDGPESPPVQGDSTPASTLDGTPAINDPATEVGTETTLHSISTADGAFDRLVGVSLATDVTNSPYFYQDEDPGSDAAALTGLSLTTAVPNASAKLFFAADSGVTPFSSFLFVEIGGNDAMTFHPINRQGEDIGTYSFTVSTYGPLLMTTSAPNREGGGTASNPSPLHGAVFNLKDFSGAGDLSDFSGFRIDSGGSADPVLLAAILTTPVIDRFLIKGPDELELTFQTFPRNRYAVKSSLSLTSPEEFQTIETITATGTSSVYLQEDNPHPDLRFFLIEDLGE